MLWLTWDDMKISEQDITKERFDDKGSKILASSTAAL
jgi:hypothetical protein